ncbi:Uma2 family endonuclease [Lyngbya sp. CCY1209]|uniref:Uma2 family endonuclease n=1 Tax=Lyngbya sp. CCY1209 TaxID=2886103 RepID=UPI002D204712|nr:Uma2 family endonuclease [Lyngbya sp. CCY1209]MEB3885396.1 Uma2 family endonuclease [Lyngbya sp. CCY1209]
MPVTLEQIILNPGQNIRFKNVSWRQFELLLEELGENRASRISYGDGWLEIMVPLPEHEKNKEIIGELVRIILYDLNIDFEPMGSTTLKNERMMQAVEPDACFYIQNYRQVVGKDKLDLAIDPPPDLAIEIDITSRTQLDNYQRLGVPELWRYSRQGLRIYILQDGEYVESKNSFIFPDLPVVDWCDRAVKQCKIEGYSRTIRDVKVWIREFLQN